MWLAHGAPAETAKSPSVRAGDKARAAIVAETDRLRKTLVALKLPAAETESNARLLERIDRASRANRVFLSLYLLQQAVTSLRALEYLNAKTEIGKGGLEAFEQEWKRLGGELAEKESRLSSAASRPRPAVAQAILEKSLTQVQPNYRSGRLYGEQTTVDSGLYYLGFAKAQIEFALFCGGLEIDPTGAAAPTVSLSPELDEVEREVLQAYRRLGASDPQNLFIRINASLKVAQDLEKEKRFNGALLQCLEVWRAFGANITPATEPPSVEALKSQVESFRAQLSYGKTDYSLGWLYLQMTEAAMESGGVDDRRTAAAILRESLPRYFKHMARVKP
jgi:hypothetical protein